MTSQMQEPRTDTTHKRKRPSWANPFVAIIIMLLIVLMIIMVLLVLSSLGVIVITWANNLSTVFVGIIIPVLGIVITLAQWLHSLSSHKSETSSTSPAINLLADGSYTVSSHPSTQQVAGPRAHSSVLVQSSPPAQIAGKLIDVNMSNKDHNNHRVDWGEAPDPGQFYGRDKELAALQRWVVQDRCRVVAVLGKGREILKDKGLLGTEQSWDMLVGNYVGNPLALKLVSQFIREVFNGNIASFLENGEKVFSDIRDVLDQQFERLSALEQDMMYWLAVEREAISLDNLKEDILGPVTMRELQEAQRSLLRRCLIEVGDVGITLQNVVMEYVTDCFVERIVDEINNGEIGFFESHTLIKAQAKDYVRESQTRLILTPVAQRLITLLGREQFEDTCRNIISKLQEMHPQDPGYVKGILMW